MSEHHSYCPAHPDYKDTEQAGKCQCKELRNINQEHVENRYRELAGETFIKNAARESTEDAPLEDKARDLERRIGEQLG